MANGALAGLVSIAPPGPLWRSTPWGPRFVLIGGGVLVGHSVPVSTKLMMLLGALSVHLVCGITNHGPSRSQPWGTNFFTPADRCSSNCFVIICQFYLPGWLSIHDPIVSGQWKEDENTRFVIPVKSGMEASPRFPGRIGGSSQVSLVILHLQYKRKRKSKTKLLHRKKITAVFNSSATLMKIEGWRITTQVKPECNMPLNCLTWTQRQQV